MSINIKGRIVRCNFKKDDFRIFAVEPIGDYEGITLSNYGTFSLKGELPYLDEKKEYDFILDEISCDKRFGSCCSVLDVPSMNNLDLESMSLEEKKEILMGCTSSKRIANNILSAYPNFIELILTEGKEAIDIKKIKGVGEAYLNAYTRNLLDKYKYYGITKEFKDYNITISDAKELMSYYCNRDGLAKALNDNPYECLIRVLNRSFERVDKLLMEIRPELKESEQRCAYLIFHVLEQSEANGDTYCDANDLYFYIMNEYPIAQDLQPYIVPCVKENELFYYDSETRRVAIAETYYGECMIKDLVKEKVSNPHKLDIDWTQYTNVDGFELTEEQSILLKHFCEYDITCLIGKAGSGKTSSVKALVKLMEDNGLSYTLLTPTGASALRLAEQTHRNASTIHRKCLRDKEINSDCILVDEFGMVSLDVFVMLLKCITNEDCKIILCGDPYQLPSIGKGCVFSDIINSGQVPSAELTRVFRYSKNGGAFVGENIRQGKTFLDNPQVKYDGNIYRIMNDYKFIESEDIFDDVVKEYAKLRKKYKEDEIIILSPFNKGNCGTYKLNETIELEYNPPKPNELTMEYKRDGVNIVFRQGSRVVNTKNDYQALPLESYEEIIASNGTLTEEDVRLTQLFNGQIGVVREVGDKHLVCQFGEELIVITKPKIQNLLLARAISTHRSQGGEWKAVINVVSNEHKRLLSKQLLYVSNTRMKECHCDIGDVDAMEKSLLVDVVESRNTWLKDLLTIQ